MHTPPTIPNHFFSRLPNFVNWFVSSLVERCDLLDSSSVNERRFLKDSMGWRRRMWNSD
jgi:carboxylesterase